MSKTVLLIDGDQYLYRACAACESETRWDDENHVLASNAQEAWDTVVGSLRKIFDHFGTEAHVLAFSHSENFRKQVDPSYKMNRAGQRKPLCFGNVREGLFAYYKSMRIAGLEADDVLGILATKPGQTERIIVANDKDMKTIPGKLWDGMKFSVISEPEADYWHLYQTLVGDSADGYRGCPGIGPKKAEKVLTVTEENSGCMGADETLTQYRWRLVVEEFQKAGLTADHALTQARLARILRWSDWDSEKKEPILWTPPSTPTTASGT